MKKLLSLLLAVLMLLSLCACGAKSAVTESIDAAAPEEAAEYSMSAPGGFAAAGETEDALFASGSDDNGEDPAKIIYASEVTIETTAFDDTLAGIAQLVEKYGGWVESSSVNGANYYNKSRGYASSRSASYSLRIPSEKFSLVMNSLSTLGNIPYSYTYTENVTSRYYDTEARLTAYKTQETRLLEMMEKAETVSDVIAIEEKLAELRYQIESLQSSLNNWDRQVNYSSIYVSVEEVRKYTPEAEVKISYGRELWLSFTDGLESVGDFFSDFLLLLVGSLPALVVLALVFFITRPLFKKLRLKRRNRKAPKSE